MTHKFEFDFEVEALGQSVTITVTATASSFPGDPGPDGEGEIEIDGVTLNGYDVDTDGIKVCRMKMLTAVPGVSVRVPEWFLLTDLIREAAWEQAEREAA
jgi:hypothetical protein